MSDLFLTSETGALEHAQSLARQHPGQEVYIYELAYGGYRCSFSQTGKGKIIGSLHAVKHDVEVLTIPEEKQA